ncbi:MAG: DUF4364 family protein [Firmicutes bacterium]|nr:DUF4364 family protein [Bacillota bacterium]
MRTNDVIENNLILLFVFDKMEIPISESTIIDICSHDNDWLHYDECKTTIHNLLEGGFICVINNKDAGSEILYTLTPDGRLCLAWYFKRIVPSLREEISLFVRNNRMSYKRRQEYSRDFYKNNDGSYTVILRITEPQQTVLEIKIVVPNRETASYVYKKWEEKAAGVYGLLYDNLVTED